MLAALGFILDGIELLGQFVAWGVETVFNSVMAAIVLAYNAALALLPSFPSAPDIGSPTWLSWLSWFFPVGDLVAGLVAIATTWIAYLAVRYVLRLVRAL